MSTTYWKLENDLCRCCHSEGSFQLLSASSITDEKEEMYSDMLRNVLDIDITPVEGPLVTSAYTICTNCIERLQDASNFKKQVLQCEEKFKDMISRDLYKAPAIETKIEVPVKEEKFDEVEVDLELLSHEYNMNYDISEEKDEEGDDNREETQAIEDTSVIEDTPAIEEKNVKQENKRSLRARKTKQKDPSAKKAKKAKASPSNFAEKAAKDAHVRPEHLTDFTIMKNGDKKKYYCNKCGTVFNVIENLRMHIIVGHFNITAFECPLCDQKFKQRDGKSHHLATKHGMEEIMVNDKKVLREAKKYICDMCKKEILGRTSLLKHMRVHKLYKCPDCPKMFSTAEMKLHRSEAHGMTIPTCGVCGYKNYVKWKVVAHQRKVHLKEKNIPCPHCDAKFFDTNQLGKHLVRHNPVKAYECSFCRKKFPRLTTLRTHERIHTGDKRKVCPICDERFVQKASLNYHMAKHHPEAC